MGMYDYIGGEQVKLFYTPIFSGKEQSADLGLGLGVWRSGGQLRNFCEGDELPLNTLHYKYPKDFIIYDYRFDDFIFVIKDGKFKEFKEIEEVEQSDFGDATYGYLGLKMNVEKPEDLKKIKAEFSSAAREFDRLGKELFPGGIFTAIKETFQEFSSKADELTKIREKTMGKFWEKWASTYDDQLERSFGELISCIVSEESLKDDEFKIKKLRDNERQKEAKEIILDYIDENEGIVDKYLKWLDDEVVDKEKLKSFILELKSK